MQYVCGHDGDEPKHMGRGQARQDRLKQYFGRQCPDCHVASLTRTAEGLCRLMPGLDRNGKRNTRPYTAEEKQEFVRKHS